MVGPINLSFANGQHSTASRLTHTIMPLSLAGSTAISSDVFDNLTKHDLICCFSSARHVPAQDEAFMSKPNSSSNDTVEERDARDLGEQLHSLEVGCVLRAPPSLVAKLIGTYCVHFPTCCVRHGNNARVWDGSVARRLPRIERDGGLCDGR